MSLRTRLLGTYIFIVIICLGVVAITITASLRVQRDQLTMQSLADMTRPISVQVNYLLRGRITLAELTSSLKEQAEENNVSIILGDARGNIVSQINPDNTQTVQLPVEWLPQGLTGAQQGTFTVEAGKTYLYVAYPLIKVAVSLDASRVTTIVLVTPRAGAGTILYTLLRPVFLAGLIALFLSLVIAVLFARSIHRSIKGVTATAESIAQGQYEQEVPENGPKEVKGLARSFNQMARQVKRSQQQLRHFVADVSHQLRTPLTSIQGFSQALLDGTASDDTAKLKSAGIINEEAGRMRRQVDELLEFARMQAGQLRLNMEAVDVDELLKHCQEIFALTAEEKEINVRIQVEPAMTVIGDTDRLEQVLNNILDNALKNSPTQSEVEIIGQKPEDGWVEIRIIDRGPGIPAEQLDYVFERFYQAGGLRSGAGLGLAIAREIIIAHGGTIKAQSEPGAGAEFAIRLPASPTPLERVPDK